MADHRQSRVTCRTDKDLAIVIGLLLGCHPHHFRVEREPENAVVMSKMAVECIREQQDVYQRLVRES